MLGVLFSRGEMPTKARLAALHAKYKDAVDGDGSVREGQDWEQIISQAINEEEEHNPKLVYVQNLMWKRFGRRSVFRIAAGHFTTTPRIPKLETGAIVGADRPC